MADAHDGYDDPYRKCEEHCNHDLVRGILIDELLGGDGPYRPTNLLVSFPFDHPFRSAAETGEQLRQAS